MPADDSVPKLRFPRPGDSVVRVGVATDDGRTVSAHFGRSPYYLVYEIQAGSVKKKELRPKAAHTPDGMDHHGGGHLHHGAGGESMHEKMLSNVKDCEALIARGMGLPMYDAISKLGIRPFLTDTVAADDAVQAYINGTLESNAGRLH